MRLNHVLMIAAFNTYIVSGCEETPPRHASGGDAQGLAQDGKVPAVGAALANAVAELRAAVARQSEPIFVVAAFDLSERGVQAVAVGKDVADRRRIAPVVEYGRGKTQGRIRV